MIRIRVSGYEYFFFSRKGIFYDEPIVIRFVYGFARHVLGSV